VTCIDLEARGAVVTGAAGGLGRAIVGRLLRSGARVAAWDLPSTDAAAAGATLAVPVDVTQADVVEAAVRRTVEAFGRIDILVNNAGVLGPVAEVDAIEPSAWRHVVDVNLIGAFLCARAVVPIMRRQGYGRIVNMSSIQGKEGLPLAGAYAASKAGLIALTKTMGKELATTGVLVNCVTPAAVKVGMFDEISDARRADILSRIPMSRFCAADEVAALVAWLCSVECSFSTGATFDISGGRATY
jgi:3-oxoacyl-[acyl-carrier protein] reductase